MKKIMFNDKFGLTKAVIEGRKTMTRRIIPIKYERIYWINANCEDYWNGELDGETYSVKPQFKVGETVAIAQSYRDIFFELYTTCGDNYKPFIETKNLEKTPGWYNKMFVKPSLMPHKIKIEGVWSERLRDIKAWQVMREGIIEENGLFYNGSGIQFYDPIFSFYDLIDRICGQGTWKNNPWVFAYSFKLVE